MIYDKMRRKRVSLMHQFTRKNESLEIMFGVWACISCMYKMHNILQNSVQSTITYVYTRKITMIFSYNKTPFLWYRTVSVAYKSSHISQNKTGRYTKASSNVVWPYLKACSSEALLRKAQCQCQHNPRPEFYERNHDVLQLIPCSVNILSKKVNNLYLQVISLVYCQAIPYLTQTITANYGCLTFIQRKVWSYNTW